MSLFNFVDQVSGKVPGASLDDTCLLFSGRLLDGTKTVDVAGDIVSQAPAGQYLDIGSSEVGNLLDSGQFEKALLDAVSYEC